MSQEKVKPTTSAAVAGGGKKKKSKKPAVFSMLSSIPESRVSKVIGEDEETLNALKSLKEQSDSKITVKTNGQSRINGARKKVLLAKRLVDDLVGTVRYFKILQSDVGKLIGVGGAKIKSIRDQSGASIRINDSDVTGEKGFEEVTVEINGNPKQVRQAVDLIENTLQQVEITTEMTLCGADLMFIQLDEKFKQSDLFDMYKDAHSFPIQVTAHMKKGVKHVKCTFDSNAIAKTWFNQLKGKMLLSRRIGVYKSVNNVNPRKRK